MSLEDTDQRAAKHAVAPRVSLADIQDSIKDVDYFTLDAATGSDAHKAFMICALTMKNGFILIGKSSPASPENFNQASGEKIAYEDAVRQVWPMMGYALRDKLSNG